VQQPKKKKSTHSRFRKHERIQIYQTFCITPIRATTDASFEAEFQLLQTSKIDRDHWPALNQPDLAQNQGVRSTEANCEKAPRSAAQHFAYPGRSRLQQAHLRIDICHRKSTFQPHEILAAAVEFYYSDGQIDPPVLPRNDEVRTITYSGARYATTPRTTS
jgi:hypothetical protein